MPSLATAFASSLDVKRGLPAQQRIRATKAGTTCSNTRILISLKLSTAAADKRRLLSGI
ncbi:hypothetical protein IE989_28375 [Klebsiella pneumoniae]|nr:hypothetical protein [Klebsiella pneumoniae]